MCRDKEHSVKKPRFVIVNTVSPAKEYFVFCLISKDDGTTNFRQ